MRWALERSEARIILNATTVVALDFGFNGRTGMYEKGSATDTPTVMDTRVFIARLNAANSVPTH
jgi:hypothetical protein